MAVDKHRRPTLRDVAREADVSVWTASNTFNNPARVAQATRERVLTAADALGYAGPNPGARTLALGRSNLVALVTDGRMSGASGKVPAAIHVTPEAATGGPLARVRDGDILRLDAVAGTLTVLAADFDQRVAATADLSGNEYGIGRELFAAFRRHAGSADTGGALVL